MSYTRELITQRIKQLHASIADDRKAIETLQDQIAQRFDSITRRQDIIEDLQHALKLIK